MDPFDFKELFTYNHTVRQNYIHIFQKTLSWEDMVKNHETGWLSLKDTLLHIMWAEDSWINYSIRGLEILTAHFHTLTTIHGKQLKILTIELFPKLTIIYLLLLLNLFTNQFQESIKME